MLKLTLDALAVLDAIDRKGSFAAAADELHRVPSALTYTVQKLEDDLGLEIFDRSGHRARLTDAGRTLLTEGRHLLATANAVEARVRKLATGWEAELAIAVDDMIAVERLYPLLEAFYATDAPTRLRLASEVFGGCWDALVSGRADLVIGAPDDGPPAGGYSVTPLADVEFVFAVAPQHPLAGLPEPLKAADIVRYRSVAVADSSRSLPPRSSGILSGQDVLTVPSMMAKMEAQAAGFGVGYLPRHVVGPQLAAGRLIEKKVEETKPHVATVVAWRPRDAGKATEWFLERLADPKIRASLLP